MNIDCDSIKLNHIHISASRTSLSRLVRQEGEATQIKEAATQIKEGGHPDQLSGSRILNSSRKERVCGVRVCVCVCGVCVCVVCVCDDTPPKGGVWQL